MQTSGKTVLITGGGSGIGLQIARILLAEGSKVVLCGRTMAKLEAVKEQHPEVEIFQCDITNDDQIQALLKFCDGLGGVDILINNAGVYRDIDMVKADTPLADQLQSIDINLNGAIRMVHHFLPGLMKKDESAIVNISSGLAFVPLARGPLYSAVKAAMHSWTRSIRKQLEATSVKVFELLPPATNTDLFENVDIPKTDAAKVAQAFVKGLHKNKYQNIVGQAGFLSKVGRFFPGAAFKMIN